MTQTFKQLHALQRGDVFEFVLNDSTDASAASQPLRAGRLVVAIRPWGATNADTGPVGPWMFACRDVGGRFHHYTLPPDMEVRLLEAASR